MSAREADYPRSCSAAPATSPASCCACSPRIRGSSSAASLSDSQAGEPVAKSFAHLAPSYPDELRFVSVDDAIERLEHARRSWLRALRRAARRVGAAHRRAARRAAGADGATSPSSTFRPTFASPTRRRVRSGLRACARRAGAHRAVHVRRARAPAADHDAARRASGLLRDRDAARRRAAAGARARRAAVLRQRGVTGSTGRGPHAARARIIPQRHSNLFAYNPLAHRHAPEMRGARAGGRRRCRRSSTSCRTRGRSRAASTPRSSCSAKERRDAAEVAEALREFYRGSRRSCASTAEPPRVKDVAAHATTLPLHAARRRRYDRRRDARDRQPGQGRGRRRDPMDEPSARVSRETRA